MLICNASTLGGDSLDVRIAGETIVETGQGLEPEPESEIRIDAAGGLLIPGLHDHHIHLRAFAASLDSVDCSAAGIRNEAELRQRLNSADRELPEACWLRAIGYHDSAGVALDRDWLDGVIADRPVRVQHRSGRLWIFNSRALDELTTQADESNFSPLEIRDGRLTGRLYDADAWLSEKLSRGEPSLSRASRVLASFGVTGISDATPRNGPSEVQAFASAQARGELLQRVNLMGDQSIDREKISLPALTIGARKFHLHESNLPDFDRLCLDVARAHAANRACAFHCVTRAELAFAVSAIEQAGQLAGRDRIEHGGVVPPDWEAKIRALKLTVVSQPHFIAERGDAYLSEVDPDDQPWLYRLGGLSDAGIPLAFGSDAPFGTANPWVSMQAAIDRKTHSGRSIGAQESLSPEQALMGWLTPLERPDGAVRRIEPGSSADLCLLSEPWRQARSRLGEMRPRHVLVRGRLLEESA